MREKAPKNGCTTKWEIRTYQKEQVTAWRRMVKGHFARQSLVANDPYRASAAGEWTTTSSTSHLCATRKMREWTLSQLRGWADTP